MDNAQSQSIVCPQITISVIFILQIIPLTFLRNTYYFYFYIFTIIYEFYTALFTSIGINKRSLCYYSIAVNATLIRAIISILVTILLYIKIIKIQKDVKDIYVYYCICNGILLFGIKSCILFEYKLKFKELWKIDNEVQNSLEKINSEPLVNAEEDD